MMLKHLKKLLCSPNAYHGRPYDYLRNQIGHGYIVGGLPVFLLGPLAIVPVVLIYIIWEWAQWRLYEAELSDCFEDLAHVLLIAWAAHSVSWAVLAIHAVFLAAGYFRRREERDTTTNQGSQYYA